MLFIEFTVKGKLILVELSHITSMEYEVGSTETTINTAGEAYVIPLQLTQVMEVIQATLKRFELLHNTSEPQINFLSSI